MRIIAICLLTSLGFAPSLARADATAAQGCAAKLPPDARTIFGAAMPQMIPGTDLRALVTATTRDLVQSGRIPRGTARDSAMAAAQCLRLTGA